ncbi:MAG: site-specific DNA-methyltransferase, partial [Chloroflexota bacterium]
MDTLAASTRAMSLKEIESDVSAKLSDVPASSIRSYLRLNTPELFHRPARAQYMLKEQAALSFGSDADVGVRSPTKFQCGSAVLYHQDCFDWLRNREPQSIHAVVTDPPYGLVEYSATQQQKLRNGRGGVWRIPPSFDGFKRSPLPRFTVLKPHDLRALDLFFFNWAGVLLPTLVPGATVVVASNPLLSYVLSGALARAGLERRGE